MPVSAARSPPQPSHLCTTSTTPHVATRPRPHFSIATSRPAGCVGAPNSRSHPRPVGCEPPVKAHVSQKRSQHRMPKGRQAKPRKSPREAQQVIRRLGRLLGAREKSRFRGRGSGRDGPGFGGGGHEGAARVLHSYLTGDGDSDARDGCAGAGGRTAVGLFESSRAVADSRVTLSPRSLRDELAPVTADAPRPGIDGASPRANAIRGRSFNHRHAAQR